MDWNDLKETLKPGNEPSEEKKEVALTDAERQKFIDGLSHNFMRVMKELEPAFERYFKEQNLPEEAKTGTRVAAAYIGLKLVMERVLAFGTLHGLPEDVVKGVEAAFGKALTGPYMQQVATEAVQRLMGAVIEKKVPDKN